MITNALNLSVTHPNDSIDMDLVLIVSMIDEVQLHNNTYLMRTLASNM